MPRNGSGNYTLPQSAFVPNTTISSAAVNSDLSDIAAALTGSVASDGQTPITGPIRFQSGTASAPGIAFVSEVGSGIYLSATGIVGVGTNGVACVLFDGTKVGTAQSGNQFYYANGAVPAPVGAVIDFAGATPPSGWLLLSGANLSRTLYPELFQCIGTTYGSGDGSTTFGSPDGRGRVIAGRDDMGGSAASRLTAATMSPSGIALGAVGGTQTTTLAITNLPSFTPSGSVTSVSASGGTSSGSISGSTSIHVPVQNSGTFGSAQALASNGGGADVGPDIAGSVTGTYAAGTCSVSGGSGTFSGTPIGSTTAFGNIPPTIIMNKIIFAGRP